MSLIADALKAAQREREQADQPRGDRTSRAEVIIESGGPGASRLTMPRAGGGGGSSRGLVLGVVALTAVIIAAIVVFGGRNGPGLDAVDPAARLAELAVGPDGGDPVAGPPSDDEYADVFKRPEVERGAGGDESATADPPADAGASAIDAAYEEAMGMLGRNGGAAAAATAQETTPPSSGRPSTSRPPASPPPTIIRAERPVEQRPGAFRIAVDQPRNDEGGRLFAQALNSQRLGQHAAALDLYGRAADLGAGDAELFNNMGASHRALGELEQARDAYRRALAIDPRYAAAWSNLGVVLDALGQQEEARSAFQEALRIEPGNTGARINLANQYHAAGMLSEARRLLERAVEDDPLLPEGHYALARVLEEQGERIAAMRHYTLFINTSGGRFAQLQRQVRDHLLVLGATP